MWDSGAHGEAGGAGGSTSQFLRGLIGALPPIHELAQQAGIDLPEVPNKVSGAGTAAETKATPQE